MFGNDSTKRDGKRVALFYWTSVALLCLSVYVSQSLYPENYDWQYTVISALASPKHNPEGFRYLSIGLAASMLVLIPYVNRLPRPRKSLVYATRALTLGLVFGILMGIESFLSPTWPDSLDKIHELLALLCFLFMYGGILGYSISNVRQSRRHLVSACVISAPLIAIGICQLSLYLGQRDLGWVDRSWREMGVPLWQSFAFWQWIALVCLWTSLGLLSLLNKENATSPSRAAEF